MNSLVSRRLIVRPWFVLVAGISGGSISKRVLLAEAQLRPFEAERARLLSPEWRQPRGPRARRIYELPK